MLLSFQSTDIVSRHRYRLQIDVTRNGLEKRFIVRGKRPHTQQAAALQYFPDSLLHIDVGHRMPKRRLIMYDI